MTPYGQADSTVRAVVGTRIRAQLRIKKLLPMGDAPVVEKTGGELVLYINLIHSQDTIEISLGQDIALLLLLNMQTQEAHKRANSPYPENSSGPQHEW